MDLAITIRRGDSVRRYEHTLPHRFEDLTRRQADRIVPLVLLGDSQRTRARILLQLLPPKLAAQLDEETVTSLTDELDWLFEPTMLTLPHRKIRVLPFRKFENCGPKLQMMTCREWYKAVELFEKIIEGNEGATHQLMACVYRPVKCGIRVCLTSQKQLKSDARQLRLIPKSIVAQTLLYFQHCQIYVQRMGEGAGIFGNSEENPERKQMPFGWYSTFQMVAETGVFGSLEQIMDRTTFWEIFSYLVTKQAQQPSKLNK